MADFKKEPSGPPGGSPPSSPEDDLVLNPSADEFFKRLQSDMRRPQPSQEAIGAALQAMQQLAAESTAEAGIEGMEALNQIPAASTCATCGYRNRPGNRFCGTCGLPLETKTTAEAPEQPQTSAAGPLADPPVRGDGPHHFHHHYHHHYFSQGQDALSGILTPPRGGSTDAPTRDNVRLRSPGAQQGMSRAEAAVRKVTQDWAFACNSRQLDDLVSTYATDAMVMRPNHPAVRGSGAIREFFFSALDAGLGEVELDVLRVDVVGDVAYEAGRCKMLVPTAVGKRREDRGKYLMILARQSNGEWRIVADCWSSDLVLSPAEGDAPKSGSALNPPPKPPIPRKTP